MRKLLRFFVLVEEQAEIIKKLLAQTAEFDKKKAEWGITIKGIYIKSLG